MKSPTSNVGAKKSRGRPSADTCAVNVRMPVSDIDRVDAWREAQDDKPSRPEAIRRLVDIALNDRRPGFLR